MALHFVSTSVLSSNDGIEFNNETQTESEEIRAARLRAEASAARPLYLQLAEREEERKAEYDSMTKKMFAPPKALDDEELSFLSSVQEGRDKLVRQRAENERRALEQFRAQRSSSHTEGKATPASVLHPPPPHKIKSAKTTLPAVVVRSKRKAEGGASTSEDIRLMKMPTAGAICSDSKIDSKDVNEVGLLSGLSSLADYASDSD